MTMRGFFDANETYSEFYAWREDRLAIALIEPAAGWSDIGAIYLGRVLRLEPGLDAAFVDIGGDRPGLLPLKKKRPLAEGAVIAVEVRRDGRIDEDKGPRLVACSLGPDLAELASRQKPPFRLRAAPPLWLQILRAYDPQTIAAIACARALDVARLTAALPDQAGRIEHRPRRDWPHGSSEIADEIGAALDSELPLAGGGRVTIEPTRSLIAIDVDSGQAKEGQSLAGTALAVNLAAAAEIPRQLALRNLGGIAVIDFIDLERRDRRLEIVEALRLSAALDPAIDWVGGMSRLGLVEIRRRRKGPSLADMWRWKEARS